MITTILIILMGNVFIISLSCIISHIIKKNNNVTTIFAGKLDSTNSDSDDFVKYLRCTDSFVNYHTD